MAWHFLVCKTQPTVIDQPSQLWVTQGLILTKFESHSNYKAIVVAQCQNNRPKSSGIFSDKGRHVARPRLFWNLHECDTHHFSYSSGKGVSWPGVPSVSWESGIFSEEGQADIIGKLWWRLPENSPGLPRQAHHYFPCLTSRTSVLVLRVS